VESWQKAPSPWDDRGAFYPVFGARQLSAAERYTTGSHHIYKMPWAGDPRINLQEDGNQAKPYQVQQVVRALKKLKEQGP